jgi:AcrR family transcriptional regulator
MTPADRKAAILDAAVAAAKKHGFARMRLSQIAEHAECSNALVVSHFGTMTQMRRAVMRAAIKQQILPIIAEGVATRDPVACKAPDDLKSKALATLAAG